MPNWGGYKKIKSFGGGCCDKRGHVAFGNRAKAKTNGKVQAENNDEGEDDPPEKAIRIEAKQNNASKSNDLK